MATATQKSRATRQAQRRAALVAESAALTFLVFEDNGGSYRWTLLGNDGESLARSRPYATDEEAAHAARVCATVPGPLGLKPAGHRTSQPISSLAEARQQRVCDDSDAERWLDEGGSFSHQKVTP